MGTTNTFKGIENIKRVLRDKLQQTGIDSLVRHLVRDMYSSGVADDQIDPKQIVQGLEKLGLVSQVMKQVKALADTEGIKDQQHSEKTQHVQLDGSLVKSEVDFQQKQFDKLHVNFDTHSGQSSSLFHGQGDASTAPEQMFRKSSIRMAEATPEQSMVIEPRMENARFDSSTRTTANIYTGSLNGKYFLKFEVISGRGFLYELMDLDVGTEQDAKFILHISYKSQRFFSDAVPCRADPRIRLEVMVDLGYFENQSILELLRSSESIHILLLHKGWQGNRKVVSSCTYDWRSILLSEQGRQDVIIPLLGIGSESQITIGNILTKLSLTPQLEETIRPSDFATQINAEKATSDEKDRVYLAYVKQWWRGYMDIRPEHSSRHVKLFSYDEHSKPRPVQSFVRPIQCDRLLKTPIEAAWFVSLLSIITTDVKDLLHPNQTSSNEPSAPRVLCHYWQSLITTLAAQAGNVEDHANLLCSLLLGFGLDAYIAIGTVNGGRPWVWVVSLDDRDCVTLWESTTGMRYIHHNCHNRLKPCKDAKSFTNYIYKSVSCLFNHRVFYANVQVSNLLSDIDWNVDNPGKWKIIPENVFKSNQRHSKSTDLKLFVPNIPAHLVSVDVEMQLKTLISEARVKCGLRTKWNSAMCVVLGQELARFEAGACVGPVDVPGYFNLVVMKMLPAGHEFKGFPWHGNTDSVSCIFSALFRERRSESIILLRGNNVQHSIRVQVYIYPENVVSTRVFLACQYVSED